jgi:hypothetical protein
MAYSYTKKGNTFTSPLPLAVAGWRRQQGVVDVTMMTWTRVVAKAK